MSYGGLTAAFVCGFVAAALVALWPLLTSGLRERERRGAVFWPLCGALGIVAYSRAELQRLPVDQAELCAGLIFSGAFVLGSILEWFRESAMEQRMDNTALTGTLLLGAFASLWFVPHFDAQVSGGAAALWCGLGVGGQWLCRRVFAPLEPPPVLHPDEPDLGVLGCHRELLMRHPRAGQETRE